ncbi:MAG: transcription antitermination factor NusB [Phascolarctobacterium sp.]|nr:transcription antitermination factor NusB [Phascolarctobacterium sp.]
MIRRIAREMALQSLFQIDVFASVRQSLSLESVGEIDYSDFSVEAALAAVFQEHEEEGEKALKAQDYAESLVRGVVEHKEAIDAKISEYAVDWSVERMSAADRNILRIAVYELLFAKKPQEPGVAINEAVEISKAYGTDDSPRFVNGILGKLVK